MRLARIDYALGGAAGDEGKNCREQPESLLSILCDCQAELTAVEAMAASIEERLSGQAKAMNDCDENCCSDEE
jgi:hypothetical protein